MSSVPTKLKRKSVTSGSYPFTLSPRRNRRLVDMSTFVSPLSSPVLRRKSTSRLKILPQKVGESHEELVNAMFNTCSMK